MFMREKMREDKISAHPSSFRDSSGFVFMYKCSLFRQINYSYKENFDLFIFSGLYKELLEKDLIIPFEEIDPKIKAEMQCDQGTYKVIRPLLIPFISYPYEWSFSQLKDAALLTLTVQKMALQRGMSLKDGSAYNIQFMNGKPIFIDSLSFEKYKEGSSWAAYKQFCQHFLAPLALICHRDIRLNQMSRNYIDGIPLDLAKALLPVITFFKLPLLIHIHLHAILQKKYSKNGKTTLRKLSLASFMGIIDSLESAIDGLKWNVPTTEWSEYYRCTNYGDHAWKSKIHLIEKYLSLKKPKTVWDFGANDGFFSRLAAKQNIYTVSFDIDPVVIEHSYLQAKNDRERKLLPLVLDMTNPTPGIGWANHERESLVDRGPCEIAMVLAIIHHLVISNNISFEKIASFLAGITVNLIIEFVPRSDSQLKKMLENCTDVFDNYNQEQFENSFGALFNIEQKEKIEQSERVIYLMRKRNA